MKNIARLPSASSLRLSLLSAAVAGALLPLGAQAAVGAPMIVRGVVAGTYFQAPVIDDAPANSLPSATAASVFANAKVCVDANDNGVCDPAETSTMSKADGSFTLASRNAVTMSTPPKMKMIQWKACSNAAPATMKKKRITRAPMMPQVSALG